MPTIQREGFAYQIAPSAELDAAGNPLDPNKALLYNLHNDLVSMGFTRVAMDGLTVQESKQFLFEPTITVDPLVASNPWRVLIRADGTAWDLNNLNTKYPVTNRGLYMKFGSPSQLPDITTALASAAYEYPVIPPTINTKDGSTASILPGDQDFPRISVRFPMAYRLTVVERGFVFAAWIQAISEDLKTMGIMCVQRGVGCDGLVATTGQRPLWMVTNVSPTGTGLSQSTYVNRDAPRNAWFYTVQREFDTTTPTPTWDSYQPGTPGVPSAHNGLNYCTNFISDDREILGQSLNYFPTRWYTPVTTDTGEYILLFPFGLCTDRFAFSDEIDLIAVSKADAYQHGQTVPITVYGNNRVYTAFNSNNENIGYDSGVRVFILTEGGGAT